RCNQISSIFSTPAICIALFSRALHFSTFFRAVYKTFLTHRCLQGSVATRDRTIAWVFTDGVKFVNFLADQ
ncbi:hypothetical protein, partial [Delftia acidovorans]|uniref:hypothetical protein n=1 Tax=Delftia acidovorans TaxID=80866 RepID=UPI001D0C22AD